MCLIGLHGRAWAVASAPSVEELSSLTLEQLGDIEITSVSKRSESLRQAPASIYVITNDEIRRSGAASVPEMLRLAPNLQVARTSASRYVITARGMNGAQAAQNFSNKLLVLIDGRSVYTPLFSGVYWDMQDVLGEDVERIEVISGPGAVLWGANAVNGVINIITKAAKDTQGGYAEAGYGDQGARAALRYGGKLGQRLNWRAYLKTDYQDDTETQAGASAQDHWQKPQGGFRLDWAASAIDTVTLQGDAYHGFEAQPGQPAERIIGHNLTGRWSRGAGDGATLQVQAFYDHARRGAEVNGSGFYVDTFDVDLQHGFALGARNRIVWGGGFRANRYRIDGTSTLSFEPAARTLKLANAFLQDTVDLGRGVELVVGAKLEDDAFVPPRLLPNLRLSWSPEGRVSAWAAASRAVRSPTPFDRDVVERLGGVRFLTGSSRFRSESLSAYEVGARMQISARASLSASVFLNDYDDLRSIEPTPVRFLPLQWGNGLRGRTYGLETWGDWQVADWWRLSGSLYLLDESFRFRPGASGLLGAVQAADDPARQAMIKSSMNLGRSITLDGAVRYVGALPDPRIPAYVEVNGRIGWAVTSRIELAVSAENLLRDAHREYPEGTEIPRSVFASVRARF